MGQARGEGSSSILEEMRRLNALIEQEGKSLARKKRETQDVNLDLENNFKNKMRNLVQQVVQNQALDNDLDRLIHDDDDDQDDEEETDQLLLAAGDVQHALRSLNVAAGTAVQLPKGFTVQDVREGNCLNTSQPDRALAIRALPNKRNSQSHAVREKNTVLSQVSRLANVPLLPPAPGQEGAIRGQHIRRMQQLSRRY